MQLQGLYAVTDEVLTPYDKIEESVDAAIKGGIRVIQLRDKHTSDAELYRVGVKIKKLCEQHNVIFLVDDRVVLAKALKADGVHIGTNDVSIGVAREIIGEKKIIGVSCYGDLERAERAQKHGADYVAFGSFFPSPTKPLSRVIDISVLEKAKKHISLPLCAIGGITYENGKNLIENGASMLAVVSALWEGDIKENARELASLF